MTEDTVGSAEVTVAGGAGTLSPALSNGRIGSSEVSAAPPEVVVAAPRSAAARAKAQAELDPAKHYLQQLAKVRSSSDRCQWSRGVKAFTTLQAALSGVAEARTALQSRGGPDPELLATAASQSGLDGFRLAKAAYGLAQGGHPALALQLVRLTAELDPGHAGIVEATVLLLSDESRALELLDAVSQDPTRPARVRLHAEWWRTHRTFSPGRHVRLLDLLDAALCEKDLIATDLAFAALQSYIEDRYFNRDDRSVSLPLTWEFQEQRRRRPAGWGDPSDWDHSPGMYGS